MAPDGSDVAIAERPITLRVRRLPAAWLFSVLILAGCGGGSAPDESATSATAEPSTSDSSSATVPTAACTTAAVEPVVRAELDPEGTIPGSVEVAECQNGYARVFYRPDAPDFESEQLFLRDDGGDWVILTYGTGIDCATDVDLEPHALEDACRALGLRP